MYDHRILVCCLCAGDCVLGDFGAATLLNKSPEQWSPTHWPQGVQLCSQWTDRFLLVVTLLERAAVYTLKDQGPHEAELVEATSRLRSSELRDFINRLHTPLHRNSWPVRSSYGLLGLISLLLQPPLLAAATAASMRMLARCACRKDLMTVTVLCLTICVCRVEAMLMTV